MLKCSYCEQLRCLLTFFVCEYVHVQCTCSCIHVHHLYPYQQMFHDAGYNPISCENLSAVRMQFIREDLHKLEVAQVCQSYVMLFIVNGNTGAHM